MPVDASSRDGLTMSGNFSVTADTSAVVQADGVRRGNARAPQHTLRLLLVQGQPQREGWRPGVRNPRVLEQHRQQRLEAGVARQRLAQVEHDIGRERADRRHRRRQVVIDPERVDHQPRARQRRHHIFGCPADVSARSVFRILLTLFEVAVVND